MESQANGNPPLSPVLLAGIALRPLPPGLLQPILNAVMTVFARRHPGMFDRLAGLGDATFLIDPIDLSFGFLLQPSPPPGLVAIDKDSLEEEPTATVRGPLLTLIQLLEGKLDGDALFFSRDLVVEGDTEAVVTLRNAIDGAGIDVKDEFLSGLGPFARPAERVAGGAKTILGRMDRDLGILRRAVLAPVTDRCEAQAAELKELREKVAELNSRPARRARRKAPAAQPASQKETMSK